MALLLDPCRSQPTLRSVTCKKPCFFFSPHSAGSPSACIPATCKRPCTRAFLIGGSSSTTWRTRSQPHRRVALPDWRGTATPTTVTSCAVQRRSQAKGKLNTVTSSGPCSSKSVSDSHPGPSWASPLFYLDAHQHVLSWKASSMVVSMDACDCSLLQWRRLCLWHPRSHPNTLGFPGLEDGGLKLEPFGCCEYQPSPSRPPTLFPPAWAMCYDGHFQLLGAALGPGDFRFPQAAGETRPSPKLDNLAPPRGAPRGWLWV